MTELEKLSNTHINIKEYLYCVIYFHLLIGVNVKNRLKEEYLE